jgi:hypothetical protein
VSNDDAGLDGPRRRRGRATREREQHALFDVLQVDGALLQVLVGTAADGLDEAVHYLVEGRGGVELFVADNGGGVVQKRDVGENEQVRVEDARVIVAHARRDVIFERAHFVHGRFERALEARNLIVGARGINQCARDGNPVRVANERGADYDPGRGGNAAALDFEFGPEHSIGSAFFRAGWFVGLTARHCGIPDRNIPAKVMLASPRVGGVLILVKLRVEERFDGFARGRLVGAVDLDANLSAAGGGEAGQAEDALTIGEFLAVINADFA